MLEPLTGGQAPEKAWPGTERTMADIDSGVDWPNKRPLEHDCDSWKLSTGSTVMNSHFSDAP